MIQMVTSPALDRLKELWDEDFANEISDSTWKLAIKRIHSTSICIQHGPLQFKVLHRRHLSKSRLARMYPGLDLTCSSCKQTPATLFQMFWSFFKHFLISVIVTLAQSVESVSGLL